MNKSISLVIPALSSNFYIEEFLINILFWKKKPSEIIIVNTSNKISLNNELKKKLKNNKIKLILIQKKNLFPGAARNVGIKMSKYDYVLFLDINTQPYKEDWLQKNFDYLIKNKLDGICGKTVYLANNFVEKIIRASTYGKAPLKTIPGSIFKRKVVKKVGYFDVKSRAGEDTDWIKRLSKLNFKIGENITPIYYKGLFNSTYGLIITKWIRNYSQSVSLPHMRSQKHIYLFGLFIMMFLVAFNWNYSTLCFSQGNCLNNYDNIDGIFIPHITKIFLISCFSIYTLFRGLYLPIRKKIRMRFLIPFNFSIERKTSFLELIRLSFSLSL